jgi:MoCo/4Fe-4S cofactor protein with predicted Tat translocation signal
MKRDEHKTPDLDSLRRRLQSTRGKDYWRSLDELADTEEFRAYLHDEFPGLAARWTTPINRRDILKLMGASLALAGLSACASKPAEQIVPYVHPPTEFVPGKPIYYATAMTCQGYAKGLLVESHMGRPTKVEGNPKHPASLGATDVFAQASVLNLYDPDRSQAVTRAGRISTWQSFVDAMNEVAGIQRFTGGAGLRILTETITSPTLHSQIRSLLEIFPKARWHQYEPAGGDGARTSARLGFGEHVGTHYRLDKADVILALDADFLTSGPAGIRYARDWAGRRRKQNMNRLYAVETIPTGTGAVADHRLALRPAEVEVFARQVARALEVPVQEAGRSSASSEWLAALVRELRQHRGSSLVIAGDYQPAPLHLLAHAINQALGNVGNTVVYTDPVEPAPADQLSSLRELVGEMNAGAVDVLLILGGNPVFNAPADFDFGGALAKVKSRVHLSLHSDETSSLCDWHVPEAHYLEAWSDARAFDGTATIIQPLIAPLYEGKSVHEVLSVFQGGGGRAGYDIVRAYWREKAAGRDFDEFWHDSLNEGLVADSAFTPRTVRLREDWASSLPASAASNPGLQISFRPDPCIFDGRFANNGWLQELPKPISKLTWDNAVFLSPATARRLELEARDVVEVNVQGRSVQAPVWVLPAHAPDSLTVYFGYGRWRTGKVGTGTGFNAYALRTSESFWAAPGVELRKTGKRMVLACTEIHHTMEGRNLVRIGTVAEYEKNPLFAREMGEAPPAPDTLYPGYDYAKGYQWGMVVNLGACVGCNACVVACEAENNTPVVGKEETNNMREMQWLRIDRYYTGDTENPSMALAPVLCMHCENAPCELVCPVQATNHSSEGLNQMIYNRCVGTRYCSNNCPYKVRRFNFLQFSDWVTPSLVPMRNPDVSVRGRGVMEKCTYCVQRIQEAKIQAEKEDRPVRDGEIVTACQQACPTQVFTFGNVDDPASRVAQLKSDSLDYQMLGELNVRPRTSYLAGLRNPNPEIEKD